MNTRPPPFPLNSRGEPLETRDKANTESKFECIIVYFLQFLVSNYKVRFICLQMTSE